MQSDLLRSLLHFGQMSGMLIAPNKVRANYTLDKRIVADIYMVVKSREDCLPFKIFFKENSLISEKQ